MVFINHNEVLEGTAAIVEIEGPLNSDTSPDLEEYINQLMERNILFILLDAKVISFVSSAGIGLILYLQKKISERNGFFVMFNLNAEVKTIYEILGFDKVIRIAADRAEAVMIMDRQLELREKGVENEVETEMIEIPLDEIADDEELPESEPTIAPPDSEGHVVIECINCKTLIRVREKGDYKCPDCSTEFTVNEDLTVEF